MSRLPKYLEVKVEDLKVDALIGCKPEERIYSRPLIISFSFEYPALIAAREDNIKYAADYAVITAKVIDVAQKQEYSLIETLAYNVLDTIKNSHPKLRKIKITIKKPQALAHAAYSAVTLEAD
jgi:dihydroneopterin aldolase